jgi:hypothetical protein
MSLSFRGDGFFDSVAAEKKNAPFPTRQWIYVFLTIAKISLPDIEKLRFQVPDSRI